MGVMKVIGIIFTVISVIGLIVGILLAFGLPSFLFISPALPADENFDDWCDPNARALGEEQEFTGDIAQKDPMKFLDYDGYEMRFEGCDEAS